MKTVSASTLHSLKVKTLATKKLGPILIASMQNIMALTWAVVTALILITLSMWTAEMEINTYFGAGSWGLGFVFLALALDNDRKHTRYLVMSGVALLTFAFLQSVVSPGFMIVNVAILAAWVAAALFKRLNA